MIAPCRFLGSYLIRDPRGDQYKKLDTLIGCKWSDVGSETRARLYQFRWRAQTSRLPYSEYEIFTSEVVKPLLSNEPGKSAQLTHVLELAEGTFQANGTQSFPAKMSDHK
jgi:hypothetical protein